MTSHQGSSNPNSGLASSVAFTPIKGIELENPDIAAQKIKTINDKYFSAQTFKKQ
jgi:U4/U6 small nuclear ribonucleoprotein PRP31